MQSHQSCLTLYSTYIHCCHLVTSVVPTLCDPMDCSPPGSCVHDSLGKSTGVCCHALLQGIFPTKGLNPLMSLALAGGFFTAEPPGKPHTYTTMC